MQAIEFPPAPARVASLVGRTLEEAAFTFSEPSDSPPPWRGALLSATLPFTGPGGERGRLAIVMASSLATSVAANLLGIEPDEAEAQERGRDALGELCNIAGGILMMELFGPRAVCHLGVPFLEPVDLVPAGLSSLVTDEGERLDVGILTPVPE